MDCLAELKSPPRVGKGFMYGEPGRDRNSKTKAYAYLRITNIEKINEFMDTIGSLGI